MATVNASWTAWDGGYRLNTSRSYSSQLRQAEYAEAKERMDAEQQIRVAWETWTRTQASYEAVARELELAQETLILAERGFEAGSNSWLDVQDTQLMVDQARLGLLSERMNRDLAAVDLQVALGDY